MVYIRSILKSKSYTDLYRLCVRTLGFTMDVGLRARQQGCILFEKGLFSLNGFIRWKGKKFTTKENEWFTKIAWNVRRPEAHLQEIWSFNAVCVFFFSQNSQKKTLP